MDDSGDNEIVARPYFSAAQLHELKRDKTLVIQCYYRGYVARKRTWAMREVRQGFHFFQTRGAPPAAPRRRQIVIAPPHRRR